MRTFADVPSTTSARKSYPRRSATHWRMRDHSVLTSTPTWDQRLYLRVPVRHALMPTSIMEAGFGNLSATQLFGIRAYGAPRTVLPVKLTRGQLAECRSRDLLTGNAVS